MLGQELSLVKETKPALNACGRVITKGAQLGISEDPLEVLRHLELCSL